jgi:hypothetical protein
MTAPGGERDAGDQELRDPALPAGGGVRLPVGPSGGTGLEPKCERMEKLTEGPVGVGTRYRAKWRNSPSVVLETVAFERPHSWAMHNSGPIEVTLTCRLEADSEGTRLQADFEPTPHGWFRLIFPLFLAIMRREERANMGHLRDAVERRAAAHE